MNLSVVGLDADFFLTFGDIGWFLLLTSILGFWRVKRWERSILSTQSDSSAPSPPSTTIDTSRHASTLAMRFEQTFGLRGFNGAFIRQGLGLPGPAAPDSHTLFDAAEEEEDQTPADMRGEYVIPLDSNEEEAGRLVRAYQDEARLTQDLRAAGLL